MSTIDAASSIGSLLGGALGAVFVVGILITVCGLPFLAWSATLNLRRIRRALERLADAADGRSGAAGAGPLRL